MEEKSEAKPVFIATSRFFQVKERKRGLCDRNANPELTKCDSLVLWVEKDELFS